MFWFCDTTIKLWAVEGSEEDGDAVLMKKRKMNSDASGPKESQLEPVKLAAAVNLRAMNPGPMTSPDASVIREVYGSLTMLQWCFVQLHPRMVQELSCSFQGAPFLRPQDTRTGNSCWQCTNAAAKYTILFRQKLRVKRFSSSSWSCNILLVSSVAVGYFRLASTLKMSCRSIVCDCRDSFGNLPSQNFEVKISNIPGLSGHHRGKSLVSSSELHDSLVVIQQSRWG